jgi:hypothetical protein
MLITENFLMYISTVAWLGVNKGYDWLHIGYEYNAKGTEVKRKIKTGG